MAGGVKTNIGVRMLKKLTSEKERIRLINSFDKATDFLVSWDEDQTEKDGKAIQQFLKFLTDAGKQVECAVYHHTRKKEKVKLFPKDGHVHLSRFDFNTFGMPKTVVVKKLLAKKFDYFINLNMDGRLPLKSIAGLTNATCRIGFPRDKALPFYDMLIGTPGNESMDDYLKDLKFYLQKIG